MHNANGLEVVVATVDETSGLDGMPIGCLSPQRAWVRWYRHCQSGTGGDRASAGAGRQGRFSVEWTVRTVIQPRAPF